MDTSPWKGCDWAGEVSQRMILSWSSWMFTAKQMDASMQLQRFSLAHAYLKISRSQKPSKNDRKDYSLLFSWCFPGVFFYFLGLHLNPFPVDELPSSPRRPPVGCEGRSDEHCPSLNLHLGMGHGTLVP